MGLLTKGVRRLSFSRKRDALATNFKKFADKAGTVDADGLRQASRTPTGTRAQSRPHEPAVAPAARVSGHL